MSDEYQGRGAGFVLQACLHLTAWKNGIRTFYYDVASDNDRIIRHLKLLGATHAGRADNIDRLELPVYRRARDVPDGNDIGRRFADVFVRLQGRSEEHTSELQSLMRISYAVFCLKKKKQIKIRQSMLTNHLV